MTQSATRHRTLWTFAITSVALFMVTLDNLVVTTALPVIRTDLHASLSQLESTVNGCTLAFLRLNESRGPSNKLDLPGLGLVSAGLFGIVWGLVRGNGIGWSSPEIVGALTAGAILTALFVLWELRTDAPMLPMRFFRNRV